MAFDFGLISIKNQPIFDLISRDKTGIRGELNFTVLDADKCMKRVKDNFISDATSVEELDGLSMSLRLAF